MKNLAIAAACGIAILSWEPATAAQLSADGLGASLAILDVAPDMCGMSLADQKAGRDSISKTAKALGIDENRIRDVALNYWGSEQLALMTTNPNLAAAAARNTGGCAAAEALVASVKNSGINEMSVEQAKALFAKAGITAE